MSAQSALDLFSGVITMRRLLIADWNGRLYEVDLLQPIFRRISMALAIAGLLCLSVVFGVSLS